MTNVILSTSKNRRLTKVGSKAYSVNGLNLTVPFPASRG